MKNHSVFKPAELAEDHLWDYAASLYMTHRYHGVGYLSMALSLVLALYGVGRVLFVMAFAHGRYFGFGYLACTIGVFMLALGAWQVYRHFKLAASFFASDCIDFGNTCRADVRAYFQSCTGQKLKI